MTRHGPAIVGPPPNLSAPSACLRYVCASRVEFREREAGGKSAVLARGGTRGTVLREAADGPARTRGAAPAAPSPWPLARPGSTCRRWAMGRGCSARGCRRTAFPRPQEPSLPPALDTAASSHHAARTSWQQLQGNMHALFAARRVGHIKRALAPRSHGSSCFHRPPGRCRSRMRLAGPHAARCTQDRWPLARRCMSRRPRRTRVAWPWLGGSTRAASTPLYRTR